MRTCCLLMAVLVALLPACGGTPTSPSATFELSLSPATVPAGTASVGTITLHKRTAHAFQIALSSSDAVASVPSTIGVPAGSATAAFTVLTRLVAADTTTRIAAVAGSTREEVALQVIAPVARPATLDALEVDATTVHGGQSAQATVRLTGAAPAGGIVVTVRSSNSSAVVPGTVAVQAGALTASFAISTRPVTLDTQLEITASYSDQTRTVPLRLIP